MLNTMSVKNLKTFSGLDRKQVAFSRAKHGSNEITPKKRNSFFKQYLSSFGDPLIQILLAALALDVIFLFRDADWMEAGGIAIAVFLSTFVSTISEYGSESAFLKLMQEADCIQCRVLRDETVKSLSIKEVVVGDYILLQAGEKIPADGIIVSGHLKVDQSALNGETAEASKTESSNVITFIPPQDWELLSSEQLFRGSIVNDGEAVMKVLRVGDTTFYGHMAREVQDETRDSPLKVKLAGLAKSISKLGYCAAALIAISDLFCEIVLSQQPFTSLLDITLPTLYQFTEYLLHALTLAITVVVVAVPEGLPMMITVVLSSNMLRMLADQVMVRKLVGIETSGSLNILFTDKTGTLTEGKLSVSKFILGDGTALSQESKNIYLSQLLCLSGFYNTSSSLSDGKSIGGNATDRTLLDHIEPILDQDMRRFLSSYQKEDFLPFNSTQKFSAVQLIGRDSITLLKGAPERLLPACRHYYDEQGNVLPFSDSKALERMWKSMTAKANRVLAIASSQTPLSQLTALSEHTNSLQIATSDLKLIALVAITDAIRPEVPSAVKEVQKAGIQVIMMTGDNRETAAAIAKKAGLLDQPDKKIFTSTDLLQMDDEQLKEVLPATAVIARALPTDKSRLVKVAHDMNLVVGMTGDGINDAPALKKADVGFAMGDGTEVAKEASDIVILDNNFTSISKAVLYGRTIFKSIRKFIVFQLTMNLCAVGVSLLCPFLGFDTPITITQMLWVNIIMDTLAGLAFAGEPPLKEYMEEMPKKRDEAVLNRDMIEQILYMGLCTITLCVFFLKHPWFASYFQLEAAPLRFMTAFFCLFIFCGIFNSFNARTHRLNLTAHLGHNPGFISIMILVSFVQILFIFFGGELFRTCPLSMNELLLTILLSSLVIPIDLIRKLWLRLHHKQGAL
ncbi:calcium-translocating P-type ATPase, PMCA-type [Sinanaerobacter sp. ZZT-01]|uniref:calcium-translocating P-type ATPase, PMCA-type n=1 Tax=Sinanaerobacter sp. ZZT-01 TaxID=3111540 RepID=UPI002D797822|nr:calcium-translocating P-type ATPase, PMCA-type [Sinanaerobacter sp. ZZT-01]WRR92243.1 calcium-translocating P-type ATPase, PMCA-type [Sinanaerobacter sp. ZZT-01]